MAAVTAAALALAALTASSSGSAPTGTAHNPPAASSTPAGPGKPLSVPSPSNAPGRNGLTAADGTALSAEVAADRPLAYVPYNRSGDVWEIDPTTYQVVAKYPAGHEIQHVVPAYDMRTLYATDDSGNQLLAFDPRTGGPGQQDTGPRSVQPVLHARWPVRDLGGRAAGRARLV